MKETCDILYVDEKKVKAAARQLAANDNFIQLSETFKLLGDQTRLKIILALKSEELCVCDLANLMGVSRSAISHQLRPLKNLRLVKFRREGKIIYYSLADSHIAEIVDTAMTHLQE